MFDVVKTQHPQVARSGFAIAAGAVGLAVDFAYLAIMLDEQEWKSGRVAVVFLFVLATSALALVGGAALTLPPRARVIALGAATGGLLTAGVLGIFSIGLPLLIAGVLCALGSSSILRVSRPVPAGVPLLSTVAAVGSGALLLLGIAIT